MQGDDDYSITQVQIIIIFHNLYTLAAASKCMQAICNMIFSAFTEENFMEALSAGVQARKDLVALA